MTSGPDIRAIESIRKTNAGILYRLAKEWKNTNEVLEALREPEKYAEKESYSPLQLPLAVYGVLARFAEYMGIRLSLRRASGIIRMSRTLKQELPQMYLMVSDASRERANHLGEQIEVNEGRIRKIEEMIGLKVAGDYTPEERILFNEASTLRRTTEQSRQIREICGYMSDLYLTLGESSQSILESIFTNIEAATLVVQGAHYHLVLREGNSQLVENTEDFLDISAEFVNSLRTDPKLLLPEASTERRSRRHKLLREIESSRQIVAGALPQGATSDTEETPDQGQLKSDST